MSAPFGQFGAFEAIGINLQSIRGTRAVCPQCGTGRKRNLSLNVASGKYNCFRCGFSGIVHGDSSNGSKIDLDAMARQEAERQRTEATNHARAAKVARETWANLSPVGEHAYLQRKQIPPIGIRFGRDRNGAFLAIPMRDIDGEWRGLQRIWAGKLPGMDTDRLYGPGTETKGAMHVIGELSDSTTGYVAITEGYANSASLFQADPSIVAVSAFSANNLTPVALAIRAKCPNAKIILVADNDVREPDARHQKNDGVVYATEAALAVGGWLAVPDMGGRKCDVSDVWCEAGAAGVLACLRAAKPVVALAPMASPLPELPSATEATQLLDAALRDFFAAPGRVSLGIRGAAGLGKSTAALSLAMENRLVVDAYVPTHELAREAVQRLPCGTAIAIRGRTHGDKENPPLCEKWEVAEALQDAGFGRSQQSLLCGKGKRPSCPHAATCGYLKQFASDAPIRFYPHQWLGIGLGENKPERAADVAMVDETFSAALEEHRRWPLATLSEAGGIFYEIGDAIRTGELNKETHLLKIIMTLASKPAGIELPLHPEMSAGEASGAFRQWLEAHRDEVREPWDLLEATKAVLTNGEPLRLYAESQSGETTIRYAGRKAVCVQAKKWLFLDASLNPAIVRKLQPDAHIVEIEARRNVRVVQVRDSALSKHRLAENNLHLANRISELAERLKASEPRGAVVAPKDFLLLATGNGHFSDLPTAHYGALRGLNSLEDAAWLVQVGRNEPPTHGVERSARAWFADEPTLQLGTVERVPGELIDAAGRVYPIGLQTRFADPTCQGILESMREQESLQALDRLRLVHSQKPKTVYLLCNLALPGLRPDLVTTLDNLLLPGRLAVAMKRDGAILGATELAKRHPDLYGGERGLRTAKQDLQGAESLYILLIGNPHPEAAPFPALALRQVFYRTDKQKGGSDRKAWLHAGVDEQTVLTRLHGVPVELRGIREAALEAHAPEDAPAVAALEAHAPEDAPQAAPEAATPAVQHVAIGNLAALFPGGFNASNYEPLNEMEFEEPRQSDARQGATR